MLCSTILRSESWNVQVHRSDIYLPWKHVTLLCTAWAYLVGFSSFNPLPLLQIRSCYKSLKVNKNKPPEFPPQFVSCPRSWCTGSTKWVKPCCSSLPLMSPFSPLQFICPSPVSVCLLSPCLTFVTVLATSARSFHSDRPSGDWNLHPLRYKPSSLSIPLLWLTWNRCLTSLDPDLAPKRTEQPDYCGLD